MIVQMYEVQLHELQRVGHDAVGEDGGIRELLDDDRVLDHALETRLDALKKVWTGRWSEP